MPFIWEYVDIKILWTPWSLMYGLFYLFVNMFYVFYSGKSVYGALAFNNIMSVGLSCIYCVFFWGPSMLAYFMSVKQKSRILNAAFGEHAEMTGSAEVELQQKLESKI